MSIYVPGYGNPSAKLLAVGEAPGAHEEIDGKPFTGPSGKLLRNCIEEAGYTWDEIYATNVVKVRPPNNEINRLSELGKTIKDFEDQLWQEIYSINPNCILAIGGTALESLTGLKGIEKYRGSILSAKSGHKVIPCLHPAVLLHETAHGDVQSWKQLSWIKADVRRAVEECCTPKLNLPDRSLQVCINSSQVSRFLDSHQKSEFASIDIETHKTYPILLGIAFDRIEALSIPMFSEEFPITELGRIWEMLAEFLQDTKKKFIAQNAKFDEKRCRDVGLKWHDVYFDTGMAFHCLFSEFPKNLAFITSVLTREPYYKDEGKEYNPKKDKLDVLAKYNAKDCVVEYEVFEEEVRLLKEAQVYDFFMEKIMPLHRLYSNVEDVGLLVDETIRKNLTKKYRDLRQDRYNLLIDRIKKQSGLEDPVFTVMGVKKGQKIKKDIHVNDFNCNSPQQVAAMIYGYLRCPLRKDTQVNTLKALMNNAMKDNNKKAIIQGILEDRKIGKTIGTYLEARLSRDGRIHCQYNINGTETGRTSTSILSPPVTTREEGIALQTMTKHEDPTLGAGGSDLRSMFIADPGWTFIEADLSMAEDRVVAVLAKDWDAFIELNRTKFTRNSHKIKDDRHTKTAQLVCGMSFENITDYYRQIGKKTRHAGNYDMGKHEGMIQLAGMGIFISEYSMGQKLEKFHAANTKIRGIFHEEIQQALRDNDRKLVSPHGRMRIFFEQWGRELFKEAYAFIPQATVSDQTKFAMVECSKVLSKVDFKICQESHDSFLSLCRDGYVETVIDTIRNSLQKPISFVNCTLSRDYELVIPCEVKIGKRWVEKSEQFPDGLEKV